MNRPIVEYAVPIDAPPAVVFSLLTEPAGLTQWLAAEAQVEPREGGIVSWTHEDGTTVRGDVLAVDPPHRLAFTYGWDGSASVGPGTTVVEILLEAAGPGRTLLHLTHRHLPGGERDRHLAGWRHFIGRLVVVAGSPGAAQTPGPGYRAPAR